MRLQNNIMALNSNNRLASNNSAVAKNIEKLSSGYKINRAGDDAAGLAISEKMRAQITGLDRATQNAQDGISLVQTAEGQLTEVHSMLNRMVDLSTQASNGTVDNDVDRKNLQLEITSLKEEIDRIATTSNFNGIKLLDGSLGSTSASGVAVDVKYDNLAANAGLLTLKSATATSGGLNFDSTKLTADKDYTIDVKFSDANGNLQSKSVSFKAAGDAKGDNNAVIETALKEAFGDEYNVTFGATDDKFVITAKNAGSGNKLDIFSAEIKPADGGAAVAAAITVGTKAAGADAYYEMDATQLKAFDGTGKADVFEINGQKFTFTNKASANKLDPNVNFIEVAADGTIDAADVTKMVKLINDKTGIKADNGAVATTTISLKAGTKAGTTGKGLSLQIGDTADQRVTVSIDNMGTKALGLDGVNVSTEKQATDSIDVAKKAINMVSTQRAKLGAVQNRLEHTINNLTTTSENMTAAESRIRDTDMAKEMMHFTKNNVLSQAAQAMLAQANQQPQQVLQLLR